MNVDLKNNESFFLINRIESPKQKSDKIIYRRLRYFSSLIEKKFF